MAIYARSDLAAVYVSDAHGGCGQGHRRPVENGAPAKLWKLECFACEDHLRSDPLWSTTIAELPETYDEKLTREDLEKRGARNQQQMTALALAKIAGIPGAEAALGMAMGAGAANCPQGHPVTPGVRFCGECGAQVAAPVESTMFPCGHANPVSKKFCGECGGPAQLPDVAVPPSDPEFVTSPPPPPTAPEQPQSPAPPPLPSNTKMRSMKREDLVQLAAGAGIPTGGTRQEVLDRLIAANNGSKAPGGV